MLDYKKKVVVVKRPAKKRDDIGLTSGDLIEVKRWMLTGSFTNEFYSDTNKIDVSKIYLLKRAAFSNVEEITKIMLDNSQIVTKKETLLLTIVFLSMGSFHAKKVFKTNFNKIIKSPNDLYHFLSLVRKHRGMGSIIHLSIKKWLISHDVHALERAFVEEGARYGWSGQDIIRIIKPKPRNKEESLIFKWLAKDKISFCDDEEYKTRLPLIHLYEKFRKYKFDEDIVSLIEEHNFSPTAIPGNVYRTKSIILKVLDSKTDEEFLFYVKTRLFLEGINEYISNRLKKIIKEDHELMIDTIELISLLNIFISSRVNISTISLLEYIIEKKIKHHQETRDTTVHLIDMSMEMFMSVDPFFQVTPAVIASVSSSSSSNVFTFGGAKRTNNLRAIMEAEGVQERVSYIKPLNLNFEPKNIFIWTNVKYLNGLEKSISKIKKENPNSHVCLISLSKGRTSTPNRNFYTIYGYNANTKKMMRLIERGVA
jgi:hypothetical protein